jgi:hypothetical protein
MDKGHFGYKAVFLFTGEFSPNFDLKNMISTYTKDLSWKKNDLNSPDFREKFQIARFL